MNDEDRTIDVGAGMVWAALAPALAAALIGLLGGPLIAFAVFVFAFAIAGMHVGLLALPLYGLLRLLGWRTGPGTVMTAATLIGVLPAGLWLGVGAGVWGGLFGLIGGGAFCAVSAVRPDRDEE